MVPVLVADRHAQVFADIGYKLLHIQHSLPFYRLPPVEHDFAAATTYWLESINELLDRTSVGLIVQITLNRCHRTDCRKIGRSRTTTLLRRKPGA